MGYKTTEEMIDSFKNFANDLRNFPEISSEFNVHSDYLIDGMTKEEFISGYKAYRELLINLQNNICDKPNEYGLFTYDKKNNPKPAYQTNYPYLWLFLALSQSGEIKDDILYVDGKQFNQFIKGQLVGSHSGIPKNIDKLANKLADFDICVSGYKSDNENDFTVESKAPRLMTAIKASTLSQYARKSMMSDYVTFNTKLYAIGKSERIAVEDTYTYSIMPAERQKFMSKLVAELANHGWKSYVERHHGTTGGRLTYPTLEYYYHTDGRTWIFLRPNNVSEHTAYLDTIPEKYRELWINTIKCKGCRKGECNKRYMCTVFGRKGAWCGSAKPVYQCELEDIPHIVETALILSGKK